MTPKYTTGYSFDSALERAKSNSAFNELSRSASEGNNTVSHGNPLRPREGENLADRIDHHQKTKEANRQIKKAGRITQEREKANEVIKHLIGNLDIGKNNIDMISFYMDEIDSTEHKRTIEILSTSPLYEEYFKFTCGLPAEPRRPSVDKMLGREVLKEKLKKYVQYLPLEVLRWPTLYRSSIDRTNLAVAFQPGIEKFAQNSWEFCSNNFAGHPVSTVNEYSREITILAIARLELASEILQSQAVPRYGWAGHNIEIDLSKYDRNFFSNYHFTSLKETDRKFLAAASQRSFLYKEKLQLKALILLKFFVEDQELRQKLRDTLLMSESEYDAKDACSHIDLLTGGKAYEQLRRTKQQYVQATSESKEGSENNLAQLEAIRELIAQRNPYEILVEDLAAAFHWCSDFFGSNAKSLDDLLMSRSD